jgi:betaine-homocysteine S-methyltransferase
LWEGKDQSAEVTQKIREMFAEQVKWAKDADVDYIIAETFGFLGEALLANEVIKVQLSSHFGNHQFRSASSASFHLQATGLPSVVTIVIHQDGLTRDGFSPEEAVLALEVCPPLPCNPLIY